MAKFDVSEELDSAQLRAKLLKKELEFQELRLYDHERRCRMGDDLQAFSILFAAQSRRTLQPDLCRKCSLHLAGAVELQSYLDPNQDLTVSMGIYLPALANAVMSRFDHRIKAAMAVDPDITLDLRRAHCAGLVFTEAAVNALRHAFPGLSGGILDTAFRRDGKNFELEVADNGCGFNRALAEESDQGFSFMRDLAGRLEGKLQVATARTGTVVSLTFPA
jgi:two-component sensor histidine kinase